MQPQPSENPTKFNEYKINNVCEVQECQIAFIQPTFVVKIKSRLSARRW